MGFQIAELFVDITVRGASFNKGIKDVKSGIESLRPAFNWLRATSLAVLAGLGGAAAYAVKNYADQEDALRKLKASLIATGQYSEQAFGDLERFASSIQDVTTVSDDEMANLLARMVQLGARVEDLQSLGRMGIGLGEMLFGGDAAQGIEAITLAQQGNFRALQRLVPEIKNAANDQERWQIVMRKAREGLTLAEERSNSFSGALARLRNHVGDAAEAFGQRLAPYLRTASDFIMRCTRFVRGLSDSQADLVIKIAAVTAGVAAALVVLPALVSVLGAVMTVAGGVGTVLVGLGKVLIAVVTGPLAGFVAGLVLAATGLALFLGSGDTVFGRIADGFQGLLDIADVFLGSWETLWALVDTIITTTAANMLIGWEHVKHFFETFANWFPTVMHTAFLLVLDTVFDWAFAVEETIKGAFGNAIHWVIEKVLDLEDWLTSFSGEESHTGDLRAENTRQRDAFVQEVRDRKQRVKDEMDKEFSKVGTGVVAEQGKIDSAKNKRIAEIKKQQQDEEARILKGLVGRPTLGGNLRGMIEGLKKSTGVADFMKKFEELKKQFEGIKADPNKFNPMDKLSSNKGPSFRGEGSDGKLNFTSLEDTFKKQLAIQLLGEDMTKQGKAEEAERRHKESQKKREDMVDRLNKIVENTALGGAMV
jgi:hypothetical protein